MFILIGIKLLGWLPKAMINFAAALFEAIYDYLLAFTGPH